MPADDLTLAAYLRAVRGRLAPESLGLPGGGVRRVPGLRREELAVLGGVSVDYYTRLEQGREVSPGAAVLEGIADGLELEGDERAHLFALAGLVASPRVPRVATSVTPAYVSSHPTRLPLDCGTRSRTTLPAVVRPRGSWSSVPRATTRRGSTSRTFRKTSVRPVGRVRPVEDDQRSSRSRRPNDGLLAGAGPGAASGDIRWTS